MKQEARVLTLGTSLYENWASKSDWKQHMESEHIKAFGSNTAEMIENSELLLMKPEKVTQK